MDNELKVIKVGGAVVEDEASLNGLLAQFADIAGYKVLVHGGGRSATKMATRLGIESKMVDGRRVTDEEMLRVVTMVYGGLVNKNLVAQLQARGVNAIGLTGADMNVILSRKRSPLPIDFGWVGDVERADGERLTSLIKQGLVPVMAPLTHDGKGHMLNTNADTIASTIARALASVGSGAVNGSSRESFSVTLTYCFEKPGVLANPDDDSSVVRHITPAIYEQLKADGTVSGGMIPKLDNAFEALGSGVGRVIITSVNDIEGRYGTIITA